MLSTTEFIKGKYVTVQQPFRKFSTIADAFEAHAELLATAPVYHAAYLALPDKGRFIDLMSVHYATDPLYASKIKATIAGHSLTNYDD
jgi:flagellum-specific peptidoglycan hydrolase FlgJ